MIKFAIYTASPKKGEVMSFVEHAESWRSKAHLSGSRLPTVVGISILVIALVLFAGFHLLNAAQSEILVIEQALSNESDDTSNTSDTLPNTGDQNPPAESEVNTSNETTAISEGTYPSLDAIPITEPTSIFVHVGGFVLAPGVVELPADSRVSDAIAAAGGFSDSAAPDALNLARVVTDGERIIVPSYEEYEANKVTFASGLEDESSLGGSTNTIPSTTTADPGGLININIATAAELQMLNGIGPSTAEKIVADRETVGPFSSIEDLMRVSGIGEKKFAAIAPYICTG